MSPRTAGRIRARELPPLPVWLVAVLSALILAPCFWHTRIHAGDLSSHAYNAWLALLIGRGEAPGLYLVTPWTNAAFDVMLTATMSALGPDWAQRISVSVCVLIFFWGGFAWIRAWTRRPCWSALPLLALVTYGLAFQLGFFNFYLGVGVALWGAAALARPTLARIVGAAVLFGVAAYCHALASAATGGFVLVQIILQSLPYRRRIYFTAGVLLLTVVIATLLPLAAAVIPGRSSLYLVGADQLGHAGVGTLIVSALFTPFVIVFLLMRMQHRRLARVLADPALHLLVIVSLALALLPGGVVLKQYVTPLSFLPERLSIFGLLGFALVWVRLTPPRWALSVLGVLTVASFASVYFETGFYQRLEDRMVSELRRVPKGARVVSTFMGSMTASDFALHMVDRACIGHCFSYANYEPVTTQFRVRARQGSPVVMTDPESIQLVQNGEYRTRRRDLPLYVLRYDPSREAPLSVTVAGLGEELTSSRIRSDTAERFLRMLPVKPDGGQQREAD